jgi:hypothetical protein
MGEVDAMHVELNINKNLGNNPFAQLGVFFANLCVTTYNYYAAGARIFRVPFYPPSLAYMTAKERYITP